jgi:hypothetical protein
MFDFVVYCCSELTHLKLKKKKFNMYSLMLYFLNKKRTRSPNLYRLSQARDKVMFLLETVWTCHLAMNGHTFCAAIKAQLQHSHNLYHLEELPNITFLMLRQFPGMPFPEAELI